MNESAPLKPGICLQGAVSPELRNPTRCPRQSPGKTPCTCLGKEVGPGAHKPLTQYSGSVHIKENQGGQQ